MQENKFRQVVLPVILAACLSFMVLMAFTTSLESKNSGNGYNSGNDYIEDWPYEEPVKDVYETNGALVISNTSIEAYIKEEISPEEAAAITELTLLDTYNKGEEEGIDNLKLDSDGIVLDLSQLNHFPNLTSLTIEASDFSQEEGPRYYSLDSKSLAKLSKLDKVKLMNICIDDLSFIHNSGVSALEFESCDFSKLPKEQYGQLDRITTFTLNNFNTGVNTPLLFDHLNKVKELDISDCTVEFSSSFAPLDELEKLTFEVSSDETEIYEQLLRKARNLKKLNINYSVGDIGTKHYELKSINELTKLEELYIQGNIYVNRSSNDTYDTSREYHDYSFLKPLTNLKSLTLQNLDITNLDFLRDFTKLTYLDLSYNYIEDISDLSRLGNLEKLNLSFNFIQNIDALAPLANITSLSLGNNLIDSIEAVRNMKQLTSLEASSGYYRRGDPIYSYENIVNYYYNDVEYKDSLYSHNYVDRGYHPRGMADVLDGAEYVYTEDSDLSSGIGFSMFYDGPDTNNSYVTLCPYGFNCIWYKNRNSIEDLSPLSKLDQLVFLDVGGNRIKYLYPIKELHKLQFLGCMDNMIEDVSCITISNFLQMRYLYLSQNPIHEFDNMNDLENVLDSMEYYMTPFYNSYYFDLVEDRNWPVSIELIGFDIVGLYSNVYTGRE